MRKLIIEKTIYKFDELSERAQEKALDKLRDLNVDHEWWNSVYDDAERIGLKITEFDLGRASYAKGDFQKNPVRVARDILREHGKDCETYKTAKSFLEDFKKLPKSERSEFDDDHDLAVEFRRSLLEDYRIMLDQEYEYLTSDQAIKEAIESMDYEFDEHGNLA
jgi:hypothetical protein